MAAVLAAASYSRGGFSPCLAVSVRHVRVPVGSKFHLEPGTIGIRPENLYYPAFDDDIDDDDVVLSYV